MPKSPGPPVSHICGWSLGDQGDDAVCEAWTLVDPRYCYFHAKVAAGLTDVSYAVVSQGYARCRAQGIQA